MKCFVAGGEVGIGCVNGLVIGCVSERYGKR